MISTDILDATCNLFSAMVSDPLPKKRPPRRGQSPEGTLWKKRVANTKSVMTAGLNYARRLQALLNDEQLDDLVTYEMHEITPLPEGVEIEYEYSILGGDKTPGRRLIKYPHKTAASLFLGQKTQFGVGSVQLDPNHLFPGFALDETGMSLHWPAGSCPLLEFKKKGPLGFFTWTLSTRLESIVVTEEQGIIDATGLVDYLIPILVWS